MASLIHMFSNLFVHQVVEESILLRKHGKEGEKRMISKDTEGFRASTNRMVGRPRYSCNDTSGVGVWYTFRLYSIFTMKPAIRIRKHDLGSGLCLGVLCVRE